MPRLRLDIDEASFEKLLEIAALDRRPPAWEAEYLLVRAIAEYSAPQPPRVPQGAMVGGGENDDT
jgi:hypothetical protein